MSGAQAIINFLAGGIKLSGRNVQQVQTLFDGTTKGITANNNAQIVCTGDRLILELQPAGTNISETVTFAVLGPVGTTAVAIQGSNMSDASQLVTSFTLTTTAPKVYIFEDMAGLTFSLTLTDISGTTPSLVAKVKQVA
jgi:ribosomal protein S4E